MKVFYCFGLNDGEQIHRSFLQKQDNLDQRAGNIPVVMDS